MLNYVQGNIVEFNSTCDMLYGPIKILSYLLNILFFSEFIPIYRLVSTFFDFQNELYIFVILL